MTQQNSLKDLPKSLWPELIRTIADVIGDDAALMFFIKLNGRRFTVPIKCHGSHFIVDAIGQDKADALCQKFRGEQLSIPKGAHALRLIRNRNIIADWKSGIGLQDLVTKHGLCHRQISHIINGA